MMAVLKLPSLAYFYVPVISNRNHKSEQKSAPLVLEGREIYYFNFGVLVAFVGFDNILKFVEADWEFDAPDEISRDCF